jgi:ubiquinone/menaquinone biosynthesis C-methylase UbiE
VDSWSSATSYEPYVGRWSRRVAVEFVEWLDRPRGARWLDVGCGTGALLETVLFALPTEVVGVDPSPAFVTHAAAHVADPRARFVVGDARALPVADGRFDVAVSGLMLNFVPERNVALREMARAVGPGGVVAAYVWDYPSGMQLMTHFWDAAVELDPDARTTQEGVCFGFCRPDPLRSMFARAGLTDVEVQPVVVPTVFQDFDDYWTPFLGGTGPAPAYATSLDDERRSALREALQDRLPSEDDGSIHLTARAWAVRGSCPP